VTDRTFSGFRGGSRATAIPNDFFSLVLPEISDQRELIVTVYAFFALGRQSGNPRSISLTELASERPLMRALSRLGAAELALSAGLEAAVSRGTLLIVSRRSDGSPVYSLSTDAARRVAADAGLLAMPSVDDPEIGIPAEQPNIFSLYEENIGSLSPILVNELEDAEALYPQPWIEAAFREAVMNNRRSWRYISRILERWKLEGPTYETSRGPVAGSAPGHRRSIGGPYRRIVER
jgi:DnaD/phage-associated family protein